MMSNERSEGLSRRQYFLFLLVGLSCSSCCRTTTYAFSLRSEPPTPPLGQRGTLPLHKSNPYINNSNKNNQASATRNSKRINQKLVECPDATCLFHLLQSIPGALTRPGGGGALNSINFSTALHRLARHSVNSNDYTATRATILSDPRFALLVAALAEAMAQQTNNNNNTAATTTSTPPPNNNAKTTTITTLVTTTLFSSREVSNIGWALAKLKVAPPIRVMAMAPDSNVALVETAQAIRTAVWKTAQQRRVRSSIHANEEKEALSSSSSSLWIPALSQLAGHLLDAIGSQFMGSCTTTTATTTTATATTTTTTLSSSRSSSSSSFQMQEYANLLWAWATAGRANETIAQTVVQEMMLRQHEKNDKALLRPQEWSNSIWAMATAQIQCPQLLDFVAHLLVLQASDDDDDDNNSNNNNNPITFMDQFKPQELSNTVWGVATLLAQQQQQQQQQNVSRTSEQAAAAVTIVRVAAQCVRRRGVADFKTQELSNTIWAMATLGFGLSSSSVGGESKNSLSTNITNFNNSNSNNYVVLPSDDPVGDCQLMHQVVEEIAQAALPLLPRFRSQELNNFAWSLARLMVDENVNQTTQKVVKKILNGIGKQLLYPQRKVTSQDIGTTLWSLATLGHVDEDLYRRLASRLHPDMTYACKPQELSNAVWALATADVSLDDDRDAFDISLVPEVKRPPVRDPATRAFAMAANELMRRPEMWKSQEIKVKIFPFCFISIEVGVDHHQAMNNLPFLKNPSLIQGRFVEFFKSRCSTPRSLSVRRQTLDRR
jgi:hypothetical protein